MYIYIYITWARGLRFRDEVQRTCFSQTMDIVTTISVTPLFWVEGLGWVVRFKHSKHYKLNEGR